MAWEVTLVRDQHSQETYEASTFRTAHAWVESRAGLEALSSMARTFTHGSEAQGFLQYGMNYAWVTFARVS